MVDLNGEPLWMKIQDFNLALIHLAMDWAVKDVTSYRNLLINTKKKNRSIKKNLKQKIVSTDQLIKRFRSKCEEYDQQSKMLEDVTRKLERSKRDTETLNSQLQTSLQQLEPLKNKQRVWQHPYGEKILQYKLWKINCKQLRSFEHSLSQPVAFMTLKN
ncbi:hypothetical protein SNE40_016929 [Patella caerulea]|uniref:Uncharacterized protein n=1 Tax=Patella caerulea TaxID=87958 RepID=A0AAN8PEU0_PATCE